MLTFYLLLLSLFVNYIENKELILANVVFRHGDRSPYLSYVNDPYKSSWPQGLGELTKTGKQQEYRLGKILYNRYNKNLINETYVTNELSARSSDTDRTLMSVYCVLAALYYPTTDEELWDTEIKWQPVPVRSIPFDDDNMIQISVKKCPAAQKLYDEFMESSEIKTLIQENQEFFDFLSQPNITGETINIVNVEKVADALFCEHAHNMTLPPWALEHFKDEKQTIYEKLYQFNWLNLKILYAGNSDITRFTAGPLLQDMITNMQNKINGKITQKLFLYSGHDSTLTAFLSLLGVFNNQQPPYASAVLLELYRDNGNYFVSLSYRNNTFSNNTIELQLPMCPSPCTWSSFVNATKGLYPSDWKSECNPSPVMSLDMIIIITAVGSSVLVVALLIVCFKCWYDRRREAGVAYTSIYAD